MRGAGWGGGQLGGGGRWDFGGDFVGAVVPVAEVVPVEAADDGEEVDPGGDGEPVDQEAVAVLGIAAGDGGMIGPGMDRRMTRRRHLPVAEELVPLDSAGMPPEDRKNRS